MLDEQLLYEGRIPFRVIYFSHNILWYLLLGWNLGLLLAWGKTFGETIQITSQRVVLTYGIFSRTMEEVELYRVKDIELEQNFWQRLLSIGTITLFSTDKTAPSLSFTLNQPEYYREQLRACVLHQRKRMRTVQFD